VAFWSPSKPPESVEPAATMDADTLKSELGHAYERGRSEERARRAGRVVFLALAAHDGSFAGAGADIDRTLAAAMGQIKV